MYGQCTKKGLGTINKEKTREIERFARIKQDARFFAMVKDLQTLNLKFDQVMFNSPVFTWERNFEVTVGIFLVLVSQINVRESYLDIYPF